VLVISIRIIFCCYISNYRNSSNDSSPYVLGIGWCFSCLQSCLLSHEGGYFHALVKKNLSGCDIAYVIWITIFQLVDSLVFLLPFYNWQMVGRSCWFWFIFCKVSKSYWQDLLPYENISDFSFCDHLWGWLLFSNEIFDVWMD